MRITDYYDLKNDPTIKKKIVESLLHDIENLAKAKFNNNEFKKFIIQIKLEPIETEGYK